MRRLALVLLTSAAMTVPMVTSAVAADPLEPVRVINVFVTSDGDVCVTYDDNATACTSS